MSFAALLPFHLRARSPPSPSSSCKARYRTRSSAPDESPPSDQGIDEFVRTLQADIPSGLHLGNKGSDKPCVLFDEDFVAQSFEDRAFGIVGLDLVKNWLQ